MRIPARIKLELLIKKCYRIEIKLSFVIEIHTQYQYILVMYVYLLDEFEYHSKTLNPSTP